IGSVYSRRVRSISASRMTGGNLPATAVWASDPTANASAISNETNFLRIVSTSPLGRLAADMTAPPSVLPSAIRPYTVCRQVFSVNPDPLRKYNAEFEAKDKGNLPDHKIKVRIHRAPLHGKTDRDADPTPTLERCDVRRDRGIRGRAHGDGLLH